MSIHLELSTGTVQLCKVKFQALSTGPINFCNDSTCTGDQEATSELACDFTVLIIYYDMHIMV